VFVLVTQLWRHFEITGEDNQDAKIDAKDIKKGMGRRYLSRIPLGSLEVASYAASVDIRQSFKF